MRLGSLPLSLLSFALFLSACTASPRVDDAIHKDPEKKPIAASTVRATPPPIRIAPHLEEVAVPHDANAYALRGEHADRLNILFVQGMCAHPLGYAQAIQSAAAEHGDLLAVQADVPCGGNTWRWSSDLALMSRRFDDAYAAAKTGSARDLVMVGYSQGAERIEWFAARYPEKVRAVVLMSGPIVPSAKKLAHVHAAVFTAGTREWDGNMRAGYEAFRAAGIPAKYIEIPNATHGDLGADPNGVLKEALDFIEDAEAKRALLRSPS